MVPVFYNRNDTCPLFIFYTMKVFLQYLLVERLTSETFNLQVLKTRLYNPYEGHKS